jgi:hypothetical protein
MEQYVSEKNMARGDHLGGMGMAGRAILKCMFKKYNVIMCPCNLG